MKLLKSLAIAWAIFISTANGFSQKIHEIEVTVAFNKTSTLVFPFTIESVDRGSKDILAQKVKGVENVLQLKAGKKNFSETNLTVITSDGNVHLFTVTYSDDPKIEALIVASSESSEQFHPVFFSDNIYDYEMSEISEKVLAKSSRTEKARRKYKIKLSLKGIFIHDDFIFYKIQVNNSSNIKYDIQSLRLYVRDKQKVKRTAMQETEMIPVHIHDQSFDVQGNSKVEMVYVLPKFTIPDAKILSIELNEASGGRHLRLNINNSSIVNAKAINR